MDFLEEVSRRVEGRCAGGGSRSGRGFVEALWEGWKERRLAIIGEFKRCAPGRFVGLHEPWVYAEQLAPYVDAFSVLTEPYWFCGSYELIPIFSAHKPVLAKDFTGCERMIEEAREWGASAVLLILDQLGWSRLTRLYDTARSLGLDALIETSSARDAIEAYRSMPEAAIGINARNLHTLEVSQKRLLEEVEKASREEPGMMLVAESSVKSVEEALRVKMAGAKAVLIGTWFMREPDAAEKLYATLVEQRKGGDSFSG